MARRSFDVIDIVEVLVHWHAGRPKSVVASSLGIDPKTVRKYVAKAEAEGIVPGSASLARAEWEGRVRDWFPELVDQRARSLTFAQIDKHRDRIGEMLKTNTVTTVHQRLCDEHGLEVGITSFRRYVTAEFAEAAAREQASPPRPPVEPGEEAQVDYGLLGSWADPATGRVRRVWAFIMVLAFSRHMFVRPVLRMDQQAWVAAHVAAFDFFNGAVRRLVPDNLAAGVTKPDLYDPKINRTYAEMAEFYGCLVDPARAGKPKDKPRVERPVRYVRDSMWRGRDWIDEADMQAGAIRWCVEVAGRRSHRSLDGAAPLAIFEALEADTLIPLPPEPFELADWSRPKVGPDCHIRVGKALYSVPWRLIGHRVDARASARTVEVYVDSQLVKTWPKIAKGRRTDWNDYPPEKIAFFMRTPSWCRHRAAELGPSVTKVIAGLLEINALHRLRSAQGVVGLADRHGPDRLDAACARALEVGDPSYRTIKGILAAGTETDTVPQHAAPTAPAHLHGQARLFNPDHDSSDHTNDEEKRS